MASEGLPYGTLPAPRKKGCAFLGWYTARTGGGRIRRDALVGSADQLLYARWKKISARRVSLEEPSITKKKKLRLRWKKVPGADGYQIVYSRRRSFRKAEKEEKCADSQKATERQDILYKGTGL